MAKDKKEKPSTTQEVEANKPQAQEPSSKTETSSSEAPTQKVSYSTSVVVESSDGTNDNNKGDDVKNSDTKDNQPKGSVDAKIAETTNVVEKPEDETEPKQTETPSESKEQIAPTATSKSIHKKAEPSANKPKRSWLALFAFFISLAAAAGVGFLWWQNQLWLTKQAEVETLKQQSLINSQQAINQLQSRVTELQNAQTKQVTNNDLIQQSLNSYAARINELGQSQPNFWLAAETKYLINLAERRLLVEQDVDTAIQLLLDANQRLTAMQDPSVFHIRTAVSEDVAALYALKTPNTDNIYLALSGLISEVQQIQFAQAYIPEPNDIEIEQQEISEDISDWQQNIATSLKRFFGNFITITKRQAEVQPQLPADQQWYVRSNLTTQLLMAQTATLDKHAKRYNDAMSTLQLWTKQYFDLSDDRVSAFLTSIDSLAKEDVALHLPSGLSSQALIGNYVVEQLHYKTSDEAKNNEEVKND